MEWKEDEERQKRKIALSMLWIVILTMTLVCLIGCKTTEYVEVPVTHTEYVYRERVDTSFVKDSIYIKEQIKGDSVRIVEYRYRDRFRYVYKTDTLEVRDTISVAYPVEVVKTEYRTRGIVKLLAWIGGLAVWLLGFFIFSKVAGKG